MVKYSSKIINDFLDRSDNAPTSKAKGSIFEDLTEYLFTQFKALSLIDKNIIDDKVTREIDVAFWNRAGTPFDYFDPIMCCECKNLAKPMGSGEVQKFAGKLNAVGANNGLVVSSKGITGMRTGTKNAAGTVLQILSAHKVKILTLNRKEILSLHTTQDLAELMERKYIALSLYGRVI